MASLVYLVLALLASVSAAPESRIIGGTPTSIEEFPYIVALVYTYPGPGITVQRCVGCLLSSWHVLTSGFCFTGANLDNMIIRAGSTSSLTGGIVVGVSSIIKHPDFLEEPRSSDVAITFASTPIAMTSVIDVLFLPPEGTFIPDGHEVKVVSWGFEYVGGPQLEFLKTVILNKMGFEDCVAAFVGNNEVEISDKVICASAPERGMCLGDAGAPMAIGQVVVGIASYYEECGTTRPDVFTRIDRFTPWILEVATAPNSDAVGIRSRPARLAY